MTIRILILAVLSLMISPMAYGDKDKHAETQFKNLDVDKNGYIDHFEARGKHLIFYYYPMADTNSDGHIDKQEFKKFVKNNR